MFGKRRKMEIHRMVYLFSVAVEMTGITLVIDAYLAKKKQQINFGFHIFLMGILIELLAMYLNRINL